MDPTTKTIEKPPSLSASNGELEAQRNGAPRAISAKRVNILLVDDRDDKLLALEAVLSNLGQNLVRARSGKEALRHLLKMEFAVILMDVSMPGMDGFETAGLIRQRPRTELTPIIFVTSISQSDTQVYRGYSLGAVDYILTPIVPEVLRAKVTVFVDLYLKTEQIKQQAEQLLRMEEAEHRKRLAEAVDRLDAETKRNRFFTLALDLLGIADFEGRLKQVNPSWEKCLGFTAEELKTTSGLDLVHPEERESMAAQFSQLRAGSSATYFEGRYRCKDGSWRWLGWTAAPFPAEKLIYIFARDITLRKAAEEKIHDLNAKLQKQVVTLTEVNKELETFNYSIAHDLRAPLRSMQSFAEILLEDHGSQLSKEGAELAGRIVRSSHHLDRLLAELLAYSRLTNAELPRVRIDLDQTLTEVVSALEKDIQDKEAVLSAQKPLGCVFGHPATVAQILANLIGNALKFVASGQTPHIQISSVRDQDSIRLSVQDNGIGINEEHFPKVFGLFERLHTARDYPGTGIGLALVRKGAERMGGRVGLKSELGKGSLFWVDLPVSQNLEPS